MNQTVNFGFEQTNPEDKTQKIQAVFDHSAAKYDIMNDIMSLGMHHGWKQTAVSYLNLQPGDHILDLACGTCDIGYQIYKMQAQAHVFAVDPNQEMLTRGRARLLDAGIYQNIHFCLSFAEQLPFPDKRMHDAICAFGFRNFTNPQQALNNLYRILKPGGRAIILEFSRPQAQIIAQGYQHYAKILPTIGERIADGRENYQYLVDSIATHMSADELSAQLAQAGFEDIRVTSFLSGLVCIHRGIKC